MPPGVRQTPWSVPIIDEYCGSQSVGPEVDVEHVVVNMITFSVVGIWVQRVVVLPLGDRNP